MKRKRNEKATPEEALRASCEEGLGFELNYTRVREKLDVESVARAGAAKKALSAPTPNPTPVPPRRSAVATVCLVLAVLILTPAIAVGSFLIARTSMGDEPPAEETLTNADGEIVLPPAGEILPDTNGEILLPPAGDGGNAEDTEAVGESTEDTAPVEGTVESVEGTRPEPETEAGPDAFDHVDNGVLKDSFSDTMKIPTNMQHLQSGEADEANNAKDMTATVVMYRLDGDVVNWTTENDFIYVITAGNNRLVMIDSRDMSPVYNTPLSGVPAEMNIIGDEIYVSLPDLCRIDVFSKADGTKQSSLYFDHEVSSFCLDGDVIYYSEHDQHCGVYKKNLTTGQEMRLPDGGYQTYFFPKLYLNKEDGILYIGESKSSGSALYYYDVETMELLGVFKKDNYGITNHTREIFHVGDMIFWGNYCLSDTNPKALIGRYGTVSYGSVVFASEELVSTYEGLFLTDTCECIVDYYDSGSDFRYILVTESYNIFFRTRSFDTNLIVGVNFSLQ